jgi:2-dehydro-3-deoxygluconokinase
MPNKHRVAAIGECMIEFAAIDSHTYQRHFAGDTLNMAVYFSRVCDRQLMEIDYVTALGDDLFSNEMLASWESEGISVAHVYQMKDRLPGLYIIQNDDQGERHFYYYRAQSPAREMFTGEAGERISQSLMHFNTLYFSGVTLAIMYEKVRDKFFEVLTKAQANGAQIVFDTNFRPRLWPDIATAKIVIQKAQHHTAIALPSFEDEQLLFGDTDPAQTAARLHQLGVKEAVIKLGEVGYLISTEKSQEHITVEPVTNIVDTTGAGDSFNGTYLALRLQGLTPQAAAKKAAKVAATVITHRGAIIPKQAMPSL